MNTLNIASASLRAWHGRPVMVAWGTICFAAIAWATGGCSGDSEKLAPPPQPPTVHVIHPTRRTIVRTVSQPSFIEAYERTSIFPKVTGYIEKWNVDIGDVVKKDEVLATLFVPELVEDYGTKKATVKLDQERIDLALAVVDVAANDVRAAEAHLEEAKAILGKFQAQVDRWTSEVERLTRETKRGVVDPQVLLESENQLKSSTAARTAAEATIANAEAELASQKSTLAKAKVDVSVARADLLVAESEMRRMEAWVGYLKLTAPFDGVIVARNANTFDFVSPSAGDPTAMQRAPHISPQHTAPIYVVDRTDIVRVFVDIPEKDANYVHVGTKATVLARAYQDKEIPATVTRTSWALNVKSRTLRAEIDLPNTNSKILPGMYAYGTVIIEHPDVLAVPSDALFNVGEQHYLWFHEDGCAIKTEVEIGISDNEWTEVTNHLAKVAHPDATSTANWIPMDGTEDVLAGELTTLADGEPVHVTPPREARKAPAP